MTRLFSIGRLIWIARLLVHEWVEPTPEVKGSVWSAPNWNSTHSRGAYTIEPTFHIIKQGRNGVCFVK